MSTRKQASPVWCHGRCNGCQTSDVVKGAERGTWASCVGKGALSGVSCASGAEPDERSSIINHQRYEESSAAVPHDSAAASSCRHDDADEGATTISIGRAGRKHELKGGIDRLWGFGASIRLDGDVRRLIEMVARRADSINLRMLGCVCESVSVDGSGGAWVR